MPSTGRHQAVVRQKPMDCMSRHQNRMPKASTAVVAAEMLELHGLRCSLLHRSIAAEHCTASQVLVVTKENEWCVKHRFANAQSMREIGKGTLYASHICRSVAWLHTR